MTVSDTSTAVASSTSYQCHWCRSESDGQGRTCPACGAPVKVAAVTTTSSGWEKLPAIPDMARIQFGQSRVQIEGDFVPVADFSLAEGDSVYFSHHNVLWTAPDTKLEAMPVKGAFKRMRAGLPVILATAKGTGRIALSDNRAGEVIAVPVHAGTSVDVHEHHFLAATSSVEYDVDQTNIWFVTGSGDDKETHYPLGMYIDSFSSPNGHGLLLLHAGGNAFLRDLAPGESILIKPPSLLYKEPSVQMHLHIEQPNTQGGSFLTSGRANRHVWLRLIGPGRVCVQSQYEHFEDPGTSLSSISSHTSQNW